MTKEEVQEVVLNSQKELAKLLSEIKKLIPSYKGIPGHWTGIITKINGSNAKQGSLQKISAAQSSVCGLEGYDTSIELHELAAKLENDFQKLNKIKNLITNELVVAREKSEINAILDDIEMLCSN
ncbi:hypothetical protein KY346_06115 [Candidatus Woesearchaeota archaeon]|nr:hypothetical protein [Candidatus Woesearchaeota archaeon]